jgi:hypothetical protein
MRLLLVVTALLWAGAAAAQIKGGGYEIDPEPERPDLQPRSHFHGGYIGGTLGVARSRPNVAPLDGLGVNANPHLGAPSRRSPASTNN